LSDLAAILRRRIASDGPLSVADYMALALGHPNYGYYRRGDPLGAAGDFITAPEVSQIFGELVGLWCAVVWRAAGSPNPVRLVELGPGRGTLMADALRATVRVVPAFHAAVDLHLVETSRPLRKRQRQALEAVGPAPSITWHEDLAEMPDGPALVIANEFFDALPIHQYVFRAGDWPERLVDVDAQGRFVFVEATDATTVLPDPSLTALRPAEGSIVEVSPAAIALTRGLAARLARFGGAALVIDYGHSTSEPGETLQAVRRHAPHPVLERPGEADLTAHVDFAALARAAAGTGARVYGPVTQGAFLDQLGIRTRAETLLRTASPAQADDIRAAVRRLTHPSGMGLLFRVMAMTNPSMPPPPGFE